VLNLVSMAGCPICGKDARPRTENRFAPFCCERCKQVDLGKWLNEEYRVPTHESAEPDEDHEQEAKN